MKSPSCYSCSWFEFSVAEREHNQSKKIGQLYREMVEKLHEIVDLYDGMMCETEVAEMFTPKNCLSCGQEVKR